MPKRRTPNHRARNQANTSLQSPGLHIALPRPPATPRLCPQVICTKVRDGSKRIVRLKEGEPKDRHVVIVDDLVQSGGTLIECHALLASLGAKHGECVRASYGATRIRGTCMHCKCMGARRLCGLCR